MATISSEVSVTVNHITQMVEFSRILLKVDGINIDEDVDKQLENFDKAAETVIKTLKKKLKENIVVKS